MIVGCMALYGERVDQALVGIKRFRPYVDRYVAIVDQTVTEEQKEQLREAGCEVYFHLWKDDFVEARNHYLEKCQTNDWIIVSDPDEWFNQKFCEDIRELLKRAEEKGIDGLLINSHDTTYMRDGTVSRTTSDFFKHLIFRKYEGTHYIGKGEGGRVHEGIIIPGQRQIVRLPKEYWYEHVKYWHEIWERASRNVFIGGGGINIGNRNPSWKPLRDICDSIDLDNWPKAREYFRKGNIDPRLKKWLWDNRFEGFDYQHEMMEFGRWYFEYLHPEEAEGWVAVTETPEDSPAGVMKYVEDVYMELLGRHADQHGKEFYTKMILDGQIRKEDLPSIIKQSREYKTREYQEKFGTPEAPPAVGESVKMEVPIDVNVRVTEDLYVKALMRSKLWDETFKPRLDLGKFIEEHIKDKESFYKEFYRALNLEKFGLKDLMRLLTDRAR